MSSACPRGFLRSTIGAVQNFGVGFGAELVRKRCEHTMDWGRRICPRRGVRNVAGETNEHPGMSCYERTVLITPRVSRLTSARSARSRRALPPLRAAT